MRLNDLHTFFQSKGWSMKPNSSAYYHPDFPNHRYKINKIVVRKESRLRHADGSAEWFRVSSATISKITLSPEGKLQGFKR